MAYYLNRLSERIRQMFVSPGRELESVGANSYFNYWEFCRDYLLILVLLHPIFSVLDFWIYDGDGFSYRRHLLSPLFFNLVLVGAAYFLGQLVGGFGPQFGISREPTEYAVYMAHAAIPYMALAPFRIVPVVDRYLPVIGFLYGLLIIFLVWVRVYRLSLFQVVLLLLLKSLFGMAVLFIVSVSANLITTIF